jgi:antitoxin Phd
MYKSKKILYGYEVAKIPVSEARERLSEVVEMSAKEAVFLERYGKSAAVIISPKRYQELLDAFEEAEDVQAFDDAIAEEAENIPWAQVKADLGWS